MWYQLSVAADQAAVERLEAALTEAGAVSVSFQDELDEPLFEPGPGETPIWRRTRVIGLFEGGVDIDAVRSALTARCAADVMDWQLERLEDQVWERVWLEYFRPFRFGRRLWICPSGFSVEDPDGVVVTLDPGLAFGTGTHPTTALCLEWLDQADPAACRVIDYGCGSGILGIAALRLGAARVDAVDIDPQALQATRDNARKNGVEDRIRTCRPDELGDEPAAIVLANILANPLIELAPSIGALVGPGGRLVLSGILDGQHEAVARAYQDRFDFAPATIADGWVRLDGRRRR